MSRGRRDLIGAVVLLGAAALVPLCGEADAWADRVLETWRTCGGLVLAQWVSDLAMPVGVAVLAVAVARALRRGHPHPRQLAQVLAALGVGVLLTGSLKDFLDRPRPGAEFLAPGGGSFPSGHVANTLLNGLAVLALWSGEIPPRIRWRGWVVLGAAVAIVAAARVYGRRHWPSDTFGAIAIAGAYGVLAMLHPDLRWRTATTGVALVLMGLTHVAASHGIKVAFPAGSVASRTRPIERIPFATAYERGWLRGDWTLDAPEPRRRSAWLRSVRGEVVLPLPASGADEVRLVARPRADLPSNMCARLRVELNGRLLGEPLFQPGWRSYVFPLTPADIRTDDNLLAVQVSSGKAGLITPGMRQGGFSELTVHGTAR